MVQGDRDMDQVVMWFSEYGYFVLAVGLFMEFLFLPFPGGTVMGFSGVLSYQGELIYLFCIFIAGMGTTLGMTATYFIGYKLGAPFFEKHGSKFFIGPKRRETVERWFGRFGSKVVFISFFIPGIRHFTGYFSGIMKLKFRVFLVYNIGGAFSWVTTYVSLGYFLGPRWEEIVQAFAPYLIPLTLAGIGLLAIVFLFRWIRVR